MSHEVKKKIPYVSHGKIEGALMCKIVEQGLINLKV